MGNYVSDYELHCIELQSLGHKWIYNYTGTLEATIKKKHRFADSKDFLKQVFGNSSITNFNAFIKLAAIVYCSDCGCYYKERAYKMLEYNSNLYADMPNNTPEMTVYANEFMVQAYKKQDTKMMNILVKEIFGPFMAVSLSNADIWIGGHEYLHDVPSWDEPILSESYINGLDQSIARQLWLDNKITGMQYSKHILDKNKSFDDIIYDGHKFDFPPISLGIKMCVTTKDIIQGIRDLYKLVNPRTYEYFAVSLINSLHHRDLRDTIEEIMSEIHDKIDMLYVIRNVNHTSRRLYNFGDDIWQKYENERRNKMRESQN